MLRLPKISGSSRVSKRRNRVKKLVYLHGNLRNTSSCNRLTGLSAKPGSSLLNYIRNKM